MSKIDTLKSQNPLLATNIIDVLGEILPKTKYVELSVNLIKSSISKPLSREAMDFKNEIINGLVNIYKINKELIENKSQVELLNIYNLINVFYTEEEFVNLVKFIEYNERGLIKNKDITTYKDHSDIKKEVQDVNKREEEKILEKQIVKLHDTKEWLIMKPITYEASCKYGSGTKWCTTFSDSSSYFYKYIKNGILIYIINRQTNHKIAVFKNLNKFEKRELSFWNVIDERIDSCESELPQDILNIVYEHLRTCENTNENLKKSKSSEQLKDNPDEIALYNDYESIYNNNVDSPEEEIDHHAPRIQPRSINIDLSVIQDIFNNMREEEESRRR